MTRTLNMAVIGPSKNTRPERVVRMWLVRNGIAHVHHYPGLPGKPDFFLPDHRLAIFVDGRFWHCPNSKARKISKFWKDKIETNVRRDMRNRKRLQRLKIRYIRIWDSELKREAWKLRLQRSLGKASPSS